MLAVAERNNDVMTFWIVIAVVGGLFVLVGIVFALRGIGKDVKPKIGVPGFGEIASAPLSVVIAAAGIAFCGFAAVGYKSELAKAEPSRCAEVDVGAVDEFNDNRQPAEGTACVNGEEVATFLDGQLRVTLRGIDERQAAAAILETTDQGNSPIVTTCPITGPGGLGAGEQATLAYVPPPEDAGQEESHEWTLHIESVRRDSADVFVTHEVYTFGPKALRALKRERPLGDPEVRCSSTGSPEFVFPEP